jgi:dihydrofolate reductase
MMRKLIAITQLSVDGVMQGPGGPEEDPTNGFNSGGWARPYVDAALSDVLQDTVGGEFDMLLGRRTYDIFAGYWPTKGGSISNAYNKATKYVVTRATGHLGWKESRRIGGDVVEGVRQLKASDGPELHLWGSAELLKAMIGADLVDEYRMWISPVVLGKGKRLFESSVPPRALSLIATARTPSGVLVNTYRSAGSLVTA